ncbi:hypothetical protein [Achromobacter marplatensis]|jgi:hypothetical protein|uniref:hypothetical protein n=1 Tax=Achromobacter marplatensis TaxID=470868 RepID=UPI000277E931|nr:hypothetical protein [Achromobacter marplatensis]EJO29549.1 hypothetical protein QWC_21044 [Achromobacter marplatensis]
MDAKEFVANWDALRAELLAAFTAPDTASEVAAKVRAMGLSAEQSVQMQGILDTVIKDTMVALLLGLDGEASIGDSQQAFTITDEDGTVIQGIEEAAWERFHGAAGQ